VKLYIGEPPFAVTAIEPLLPPAQGETFVIDLIPIVKGAGSTSMLV
jgi:hypothetical protein